MTISRVRTYVTVVALVLVATLTGAALADDERVERRGGCVGGPSEWRLLVRQETESSLRVRFEVDGDIEGQTWQLFISDDGVRIFAGSKVARDGGSLRVVREIHDRRGVDEIEARGVNLLTGETCGRAVSF